MSSSQKRGFRLPWGAERGPDDGSAASATLDVDALVARTSVRSDEFGEGPLGRADDAQSLTTDAAPAAPDATADTTEAAMIDAEAPTTESAAVPSAADAEAGGAWPSSDSQRVSARPPIRVEGEPRLPRRDNPLVAGLVKAMHEAALASRDETAGRLAAEATARVEAIRARATTETADLRKRADDDVGAIREWSKAEMARVRQATEDRIEARRAELAGELERHAASVSRLVDEVATTVAAFGDDMDQFFTKLLAESDPARLATLAEQAPDPPDLRGEGPSATDLMDEPAAGLQADAAAEAEAAATEGLDPSGTDDWPTAVLASGRRTDPLGGGTADANGPEATRLLVSGLTSVAGISAFKGALAQLPGIRSVSVSSGERGVFVFAVSHDPGVDLDSGVSSLVGFSASITDATNDGFTVVAQEPS